MIEDLLQHLLIEDIRPLGMEIQGRCPLHEKRTGERERRPDHWSINRRSGSHHCFSCEYSGSLVKLIMDLSDLGLWDAHRLMRQFGVELGEIEEAPWEPPVMTYVAEEIERFDRPPARSLSRRRLTLEAVSRFQIRWDSEETAWVFPIKGPTGETWGYQTKSRTKVRNVPPGIKKSRTLFGLDVLTSDSMVVLVESPLDVAYLDTLGVPALAAFGVQISDDQMRLIVERCDDLVLALDNDKAGLAETRRLLDERWHHRIPTLVFNYGSQDGKDPGELEPDAIRTGLDHAVLASFW